MSGIGKLKIKENKTGTSRQAPKYSLTYGVFASADKLRQVSYDILTALKEHNDAILEINSSCMSLSPQQSDSAVLDFMESVRQFGLAYRYRKFLYNGGRNIFSFLLKEKEVQGHELWVYVPDRIWQLDDFRSIFPVHGARYYILKAAAGSVEASRAAKTPVPGESMEPGETLDRMLQMTEEEKLGSCGLVIFDSAIVGSMGVYSESLSLEDMKQRLGI